MGLVHLSVLRHGELSIVGKGLCNNKITSGGYFTTLCSLADAECLQTLDFKSNLPEKLAQVNIVLHTSDQQLAEKGKWGRDKDEK